MQVVAFNLGGTAQMAFDQQRIRISAERERGGVIHRNARNELLWLADVRDDFLQGQLGAPGHARHGEGSAHQLEEPAAGDGIDPLRGALGKFAVQHLLEFGRSRELFQAAPVLRPLRLR